MLGMQNEVAQRENDLPLFENGVSVILKKLWNSSTVTSPSPFLSKETKY